MKRKIAIIGVGHVGVHVASMLVTRHVCDELVLIDKDEKKAFGHAWDLTDTMAYQGHTCKIKAGGYSDIGDADILIFSACGGYFNENRLEELDESIEIVDEVAPKIEQSGFHGIVISITNPCDLVAYYLQTKIGATVIGSGTMLDSARFRTYIANELAVDVRSVEAYCMGEHGDSQVPVWSQVSIGGKPLSLVLAGIGKSETFPYADIEQKTIFAGAQIAGAKGCTEFGIGLAACELTNAILQDENRILPCSTLLQGEYGETGMYASIPCLIGAGGVKQTWPIQLTEEESNRFHNSCSLMQHYIDTKLS
ncbi:MAG: L-lactate dehydrogenase [Agathobacter sp.]|nr:L-lactate dehydrogenase [Agathobacter sp.]